MDLLPATVYQSPPRPVRTRHLNTIIEETDETIVGVRSDSEGDGSDSTVVGKPAAWNSKVFVATSRKSSRLATNMYVPSPIDQIGGMSPCSSNEEGSFPNSQRSSYMGSEGGTVFSDDSCPSLASDPTTFATDSERNSITSSKSGRNRYPALLIPRNSWTSVDSPIKEITFGMSPAAKIRLSPAQLSNLIASVPEENAPPPSLGSGSSVASDSPCVPCMSGPVTPDLRQLEVSDGEIWGMPLSGHSEQPLEIALDEHHSILLSPAEAHDSFSENFSSFISAREREWGDIVVRFPVVPGGNPLQDRPALGSNPSHSADLSPPSATGIHLPDGALKTLEHLTRERSPDEKSDLSRATRMEQEMCERTSPTPGSRPRSFDGGTPLSDHSYAKLSDYSFSQLSIPSPGGFFSSLQAGTRHTWCLNGPRTSVPTSAIAEKFYGVPWEKPSVVKETILTIDDTNSTDGPPTARQVAFNPPALAADPIVAQKPDGEDTDLYGAADEKETLPDPVVEHEYEEAYQEELRQAAEAHKDRTVGWLAEQTSYLAALRETNPVNDPADFLPSPHPFSSADHSIRDESIDSVIRKTVHFLEEPKDSIAEPVSASCQNSPESDDGNKEPVFLAAFEHLFYNRKRRDAFLCAKSRLEAIRSTRIALPDRHVNDLLGQHSIPDHKRPKYTGPFNQNPRATGIFDRTPAQLAFAKLEKEQKALKSVQASNWQIEALRSLYGGRLLASPPACDRLNNKATIPMNDPVSAGSRRLRVLDFGGESTASWGWHAALQWPTVKVCTVISKEQAQSQRPADQPRPSAPFNHRTVSVPHLWQLPFRNNHFDVISARGLFTLLKHNPVPGVPEIDEWDLTLRECMRVLKPGGYIDYVVMDSSIARAGPRGEALSVEFGFDLHRRGYERDAARSWLRRLKKEGFVGVKRAWMFLPMGSRDQALHTDESGHRSALRTGPREFIPAPRPLSEVSTVSKIIHQYMDVEAVQGPVGSTQDVADITGLLGAKMWEEWVVKVRMETGREEKRLLEGIDEVIEEGKTQGSGWKVLVGWARKPRVLKSILKRSEIHMALAEESDSPISPHTEDVEAEVETGVIPMIIQE